MKLVSVLFWNIWIAFQVFLKFLHARVNSCENIWGCFMHMCMCVGVCADTHMNSRGWPQCVLRNAIHLVVRSSPTEIARSKSPRNPSVSCSSVPGSQMHGLVNSGAQIQVFITVEQLLYLVRHPLSSQIPC